MKHKGRGSSSLTDLTRHTCTVSMRTVLRRGHEKRRTPTGLDSFILGLPQYPQPVNRPRPRPLNQGDFQLLISAESIAALEALDSNDVGIADIWLTQAFQGGRISETLKLCRARWPRPTLYLAGHQQGQRRGLGHAVLPTCLRTPIAAPETHPGKALCPLRKGTRRARWTWTRTTRGHVGSRQTSVPAALSNPDLAFEVSQTGFRNPWTQWFESLGLKWITTHQTRLSGRLASPTVSTGSSAASSGRFAARVGGFEFR
jgi:integrase